MDTARLNLLIKKFTIELVTKYKLHGRMSMNELKANRYIPIILISKHPEAREEALTKARELAEAKRNGAKDTFNLQLFPDIELKDLYKLFPSQAGEPRHIVESAILNSPQDFEQISNENMKPERREKWMQEEEKWVQKQQEREKKWEEQEEERQKKWAGQEEQAKKSVQQREQEKKHLEQEKEWMKQPEQLKEQSKKRKKPEGESEGDGAE